MRLRTLHPPAHEADIAVKLEAMRRAYEAAIAGKSEAIDRAHEAASNADKGVYHLLAALNMCGRFRPLPKWLFEALRAVLATRLPQKPDLHSLRWLMVREGKQKRDGAKKPPSWEKAYSYAAERLAGTRWAGSERTMKASYQIFERVRRIG